MSALQERAQAWHEKQRTQGTAHTPMGVLMFYVLKEEYLAPGEPSLLNRIPRFDGVEPAQSEVLRMIYAWRMSITPAELEDSKMFVDSGDIRYYGERSDLHEGISLGFVYDPPFVK